jgi:hypothetical protein
MTKSARRILTGSIWVMCCMHDGLFQGQSFPPTFLKKILMVCWMSYTSRDFRPIFGLQVTSPCIYCLGNLTGVTLLSSVKRIEGKGTTDLGAYVRANNAASGARCVFTSKSTQALASPSWNNVANAKLLAPFSSINQVRHISDIHKIQQMRITHRH